MNQNPIDVQYYILSSMGVANQIEEYCGRLCSKSKKRYRRRIVVVDIIVYSASAVIAGTGILLSTIIMTLPAVVTICISAATTIAGSFNIIAKTCTDAKVHDCTIKLHASILAYSKLSSLISSYLSDGKISDEEFATIIKTYN